MKNVKITEQGYGWYVDSTGKVIYTNEDARYYWQEWQCCDPRYGIRRLEESFKRLEAEGTKLWD